MSLMNQYYVFLGFLPLPVAPEKIEITVPNLNKTITLVDLGEVNIVREGGLKEISFDILLPSFNYPFANYSFGSFSISQAIGYLEYLKQSGDTAFFIVTRCRKGIPSWWTNIRVTLEDFKVIEDANNGTDVIVSVNLREYKEYATKLAKVEKKDGKLTATFDNVRPITGNISPFLYNIKKFINKDGTTSQVIEIQEDTTAYNETKKQDGKGSIGKVKDLKKANPNLKNVIKKGTKIKPPYTSTAPYSTWADKPTYQSTWADKPNLVNSSVFGNVSYDELVYKSGTISAAKPTHSYWDKYGNIHRSKGGF